jgi:hypothetical protein
MREVPYGVYLEVCRRNLGRKHNSHAGGGGCKMLLTLRVSVRALVAPAGFRATPTKPRLMVS